MRYVLATAALLSTAPVFAQERDYCPERPGLDTPACIVDRGHVSIETSLIDWTLDRDGGAREDTILDGDTLVRVGVTDRIEARVGWTPFAHVRDRDAVDRVHTADRVGDVSLGAKISLAHPDGSALSVAVLPYVTLPVGRVPAGAGDWGAGLLLPVTWEISDAVSLDITPEADAAVDEDGYGRHFAGSTTAGLSLKLAEPLSFTPELQVLRDDDPSGHVTQALAAASLAWMATKSLQFDVFGAAGLNRAAPDAEIYAGIARRF